MGFKLKVEAFIRENGVDTPIDRPITCETQLGIFDTYAYPHDSDHEWNINLKTQCNYNTTIKSFFGFATDFPESYAVWNDINLTPNTKSAVFRINKTVEVIIARNDWYDNRSITIQQINGRTIFVAQTSRYNFSNGCILFIYEDIYQMISCSWGAGYTIDYYVTELRRGSFLIYPGLNHTENFSIFNVKLPDTPIPPNEPDGNRGDYDDSSDPIDIPSLPSFNVINTHMLQTYLVDNAGISELADYLWSTNFFTNIIKLFQDPMQAIISLQYVKYDVGSTLPGTIKIGNLDSDVSAQIVLRQFIELDCGTLNVKEYFGNALDYNPTTQVNIYLPYIGMVSLDPDDIMESNLHVVYHIDSLSGTAVCFIECLRDRDGTELRSVLYAFTCNVNTQLPVTGADFTQLYRTILSIGGSFLNYSAGASGAVLNDYNTAREFNRAKLGEPPGLSSDVTSMYGLNYDVAGNVMSMKSTVQRSGSIGGAAGLMSVEKPYLIIHRAINAYPENYKDYMGLPCNMFYNLSALEGFNKLSAVRVENLPRCTNVEKEEIRSLLMKGVYF